MTELKLNSRRRGVSPIIATLMLIAITVVGGILIFVFSQGFFNTNQVTSTSAPEQLSVTGWNFTKVSAITTTSGFSDSTVGMLLGGVGSKNNTATSFSAGDWVLITVKNSGGTAVVISKVTVNGIGYTFGGVPTAASGTIPAEFSANGCKVGTSNKCLFVTNGGIINGDISASTNLQTTSSVPAGKQVIIGLELGGANFAPIKVGQTATIQISTGNGNTYLATATAGLAS